MIIGSTLLIINTLITIIAPVVVGCGIIKNTKDKESKFISKIIGWLFNLFSKSQILYNYIHHGLENLILKFIFKINSLKYRKEFRSSSFFTLLIVLATISIISFLYAFIGKLIFPDSYEEIKSLVIDNLSNSNFNISTILDILLNNFKIILQLFTYNTTFIKLPIFIILSIVYISMIYHGINSINQINDRNFIVPFINKEVDIAFKLKSITFKNILIMVIFQQYYLQ